MKYEKIVMKMSDGNENTVHSWIPDGAVKGVVVLSHGMSEHASRYGGFGEALAREGYALYGEDHRGHGETALNAQKNGSGRLGYLADKDGFFRVVDDIHEEVLKVREMYPGKKIVLFGHSFGSFVSQCFIEKYADSIDGCVLCGTAGPRPAVIAGGKILASVIAPFKGRKNVSVFVDRMAFGAYNKRIRNPRTLFDWLSRDNAQVDKYMVDDLCGFECTVGFFLDMFSGLSYIHKSSHMKAIPQNLPVLFIAGTGDPVGDYGETVKNLAEIYNKNGMKNVTLKLYPEARHELLNEINRAEIEQDVLNWIKSL